MYRHPFRFAVEGERVFRIQRPKPKVATKLVGPFFREENRSLLERSLYISLCLALPLNQLELEVVHAVSLCPSRLRRQDLGQHC